jgi:hypothetical protein
MSDSYADEPSFLRKYLKAWSFRSANRRSTPGKYEGRAEFGEKVGESAFRAAAGVAFGGMASGGWPPGGGLRRRPDRARVRSRVNARCRRRSPRGSGCLLAEDGGLSCGIPAGQQVTGTVAAAGLADRVDGPTTEPS